MEAASLTGMALVAMSAGIVWGICHEYKTQA